MAAILTQSAREQDENGFLFVRGCPLSSFGVFDYSAGQIGITDGDPERIVKVFRPESAVNDIGLINSLKNVPLINDHEMLSGFANDESTTAPEEYGIDGVLTGDIRYERPWLKGDLKIFTRSLQSDLQKGKKDLSLGYTCDFAIKPGVYNGQPYEAVQTNMRGNHIALVDEGRIPGARVLDGKRLCFDSLSFGRLNISGATMAQRKRLAMDADTVTALKTQLKALLPTFEQFLSEESAEPAHAGAPAQPGAAAVSEQAPPVVAPAAAAPAATPTDTETPVSVAPPAQPAAAVPPTDQEGGEPMDLQSAVAALKNILAQMEQALAAQGQAIAPENSGEAGGESGGSGEADQGGEPPAAAPAAAEPATPAPAAESQDQEGEENMTDTVEGLEGTAREGATDQEGGGEPSANGQGTASPGPAAGTHEGEGADAALKRFYADSSAKSRLYGRLSKIVGAFDCAAMDARGVAAYGVQRLKIKAPKGQELTALESYLAGVEATRRVNTETARVQQVAQDAATHSAVDDYLAGSR